MGQRSCPAPDMPRLALVRQPWALAKADGMDSVGANADLVARFYAGGRQDRVWPGGWLQMRFRLRRTGRTGLGGQRQRVWIAMSLAQLTDILPLEEASNLSDVAHQEGMLDLRTWLRCSHRRARSGISWRGNQWCTLRRAIRVQVAESLLRASSQSISHSRWSWIAAAGSCSCFSRSPCTSSYSCSMRRSRCSAASAAAARL